jgi:protein-S-isoprenylcysteine O-methyltransferase Ste14
MKLIALIGSGDKIGLFILPFLIIGLLLNFMYPEVFRVGGPSALLKSISIIILAAGLIIWMWSVFLILTKVTKNELITTGPYSIVRHPLYTGVALLVIPWLGFLLDSWLGVFIGTTMYFLSRKFSHQEEEILSQNFGTSWSEYCKAVKIKWL